MNSPQPTTMENQNHTPPPEQPQPQPTTMENQNPTQSPDQPDTKRLKTSPTTDDTNTTEKKPRYKRRKVAILFAYCGVGYQGMQKNPGAKTIEGDLEEALYLSAAVPENERGCPNRYDFARSARTDKGVSAVGQVVSGKFYVDPPGFVDRLNSHLPDQFRVFGYKRVTASFNAKKFCDRRRYVYLLPVFALDPKCHCDRDCGVCASKGWKFYGGFDGDDVQSGISSNTSCALSGNLACLDSESGLDKTCEVQSDISSNISCALLDSNGDACKEGLNAEPVIAEDQLPENDSNADVTNGVEKVVKENVFSYGEEERGRFNKILKQYEGTHNFHNFTTRTKAADPSANRYIISFHANTTVTVDGIEFVKCEVVGQSFMLHQIRKMIGVAVAIMRNCAPESLIETALQQDVRITVPTAPEVGLYLDACLFSSYNKKWRDTHEEVSMKAYTDEAEEFKLKYIYSHIASTERKEGAVAVWLHSLNHRSYPDLGPEDKSGANEVPGNQDD